jgi:hypothetical protein
MVKTAKKERKFRKIMPAMGLVIAVALGIVAWFLAPEIIDLAKKNASINEQLTGMTLQEQDYFEYAVAAFLWLLFFGMAMLAVSIAIGEDPQEEQLILRPKEKASPREVKAYLKKVKAMEERRLKQAEAKRKADERAAKRRG